MTRRERNINLWSFVEKREKEKLKNKSGQKSIESF